MKQLLHPLAVLQSFTKITRFSLQSNAHNREKLVVYCTKGTKQQDSHSFYSDLSQGCPLRRHHCKRRYSSTVTTTFSCLRAATGCGYEPLRQVDSRKHLSVHRQVRHYLPVRRGRPPCRLAAVTWMFRGCFLQPDPRRRCWLPAARDCYGRNCGNDCGSVRDHGRDYGSGSCCGSGCASDSSRCDVGDGDGNDCGCGLGASNDYDLLTTCDVCEIDFLNVID